MCVFVLVSEGVFVFLCIFVSIFVVYLCICQLPTCNLELFVSGEYDM